MSDETNGSNGRLDRIEAALEKLTEAHLRHEFTTAERRQALEKEFEDNRQRSEDHFAKMEALQQSTQKHLDYLTQLAGVFADRTVELEEKAQRVKDAL